MTSKCVDCGCNLPPKLGGQGGHNQIRCATCRPIDKSKRRMEMYWRKKARIHVVVVRPPIMVTYPGVAATDYYTRAEYDKYRHDMPEGAIVRMK